MTIGKLERDGLIAGDYPLKAVSIVVHGATGTAVTEFKRGDVIALDTNGVPVLVDSAVAGAEKPVGIITDNIAVAAGETQTTTMYIKGEFNRRFLRFGGNDTVDNHLRHMNEIGLIVRETRI